MNPLKWPARAFVAVVDWLTGLHSTANDRIAAATADLRCPWCHLDTCYGAACQPHGPDDWKHAGGQP